MNERSVHDPILARFRAALDEIYGAQLERVVLFGSRARGEARCASASSTILGRFLTPGLTAPPHTATRRR
jgi:predicted nucleotidyltransferase